AGLPGDFNNDGAVDAADYTVWRDGLGAAYTNTDYQVWRDNYGATAGSPAAATAPEPAAVVLAILSSSLWVSCAGRRRKRRSVAY
ncbi:MAG: hypothetical protein KDA37_04235, partial [Planctomycetales bacterium]|nr:hypothetical protein [Planctomycetales bacterium]